MVQKKDIQIVAEFKRKMSEEINVDRMILFGSRVRGDFSDDSDFDIIIVSEDFKDTVWYKRPLSAYLAWDEEHPVEILCYTPEEFERNKFVNEILKESVEV